MSAAGIPQCGSSTSKRRGAEVGELEDGRGTKRVEPDLEGEEGD
jgi:hypothetical protein